VDSLLAGWREMDSNHRSAGHLWARLARPAAPACEGAGAVQRDSLCSASHSMEPIDDVVWVGCGLSRCSAASAFRRYNSNIPFAFQRLDQQFAERPYQGINASGEYHARPGRYRGKICHLVFELREDAYVMDAALLVPPASFLGVHRGLEGQRELPWCACGSPRHRHGALLR
jgi:hypothetical protein